MTRSHMAMQTPGVQPWEQRQLRAQPPAPRAKKHTIPKFKFGITRPWCFEVCFFYFYLECVS